jgi:membrane protease YdiL (CAAX protease family)
MSQSFDDILRETSFGAYLLFVGAFVFVNVVGAIFKVGVGLGLQATIVAYEVVGILGAALIYRAWAGDRAAPSPAWGTIGTDVLRLLVPMVAVIVFAIWANVTVGLTVELVPSLEEAALEYQRQVEKILLKAEGLDYALGVVAICIAAPLCEEVLFRGTIYPEQRKSNGIAWAAALNGLLFAAFHVNELTLIPLTVVGAFFAQLTAWTRSIWPPILAHALFNTFNSLVLPRLHDVGVHAEDPAALNVGPWSIDALGQYAGGCLVLGGLGVALWWASARLLADDGDGGTSEAST